MNTTENMSADELLAHFEDNMDSIVAKSRQLVGMRKGATAFERYWAGSAAASYCHHVESGAVRRIEA
jgi:hypothetical protein